MRTRTIRWLMIVAALAFPIATVVEIVHLASTEPSPPPAAELTTNCAEGDALSAYDHDAAVAYLTKLRDADDPNPDRLCAAQLLTSLEPPTLGDRFAQAVEETANRVIGGLAHGREISIDGTNTAVLLALIGIEVMLLVIGLGQYSLWRAERTPGPVQVGEIDPPKDDESCTALAELMRERLKSAGVPPGTVAPGELRALIVDAVEAGATTNKTWLGEAMTAIGTALNPKVGLTTTGKAFRDTTSKRCAITVEASVTRTGQNFDLFTEYGDSYEEVAVDAAYRLYQSLLERQSVKSRTPSWLSWNSIAALRSYHEAETKVDANDRSGAVEALRDASTAEPSNVLILIKRAQVLWDLFSGGPDDRVLALPTPSTPTALEALQCALEAVARAAGSDDARFIAAIYLSYAEQFVGGWEACDDDVKSRTITLLENVVRSQRFRSRHWQFGPKMDEGSVGERCRDASEILLRRLVKRQRYWNVLRLAWPLATRREAVDRCWPWSRVRYVRRWAALALLDGCQWDRIRLDGNVETWSGKDAWQVVVSCLRRGRIRTGLRVFDDPDGIVEWNLASAYACEVRMIESIVETPAYWSRAAGPKKAARSFVSRCLVGASRRYDKSSLDELISLPEFRATTAGANLVGYLEDWAVPLLSESPAARTERVRSDQMDLVQTAIATSVAAWTARLLSLNEWSASANGDGTRLTRGDMLAWFEADAVLWRGLQEWTAAPADGGARRKLETTVKTIDGKPSDADDDSFPSWTAPRWNGINVLTGDLADASRYAMLELRAVLSTNLGLDMDVPSTVASYAEVAQGRWTWLRGAIGS